jgi:hypothetical protein
LYFRCREVPFFRQVLAAQQPIFCVFGFHRMWFDSCLFSFRRIACKISVFGLYLAWSDPIEASSFSRFHSRSLAARFSILFSRWVFPILAPGAMVWPGPFFAPDFVSRSGIFTRRKVRPPDLAWILFLAQILVSAHSALARSRWVLVVHGQALRFQAAQAFVFPALGSHARFFLPPKVFGRVRGSNGPVKSSAARAPASGRLVHLSSLPGFVCEAVAACSWVLSISLQFISFVFLILRGFSHV